MAEQVRDLRAQQAAEREDQMRDRFGLLPGGEGRPGVDALLQLSDGEQQPFEVKSSDGDSVSTARDVGRRHIEKWRKRHWLFGFYKRGTRNPPEAIEYIYASPRQLEPWIAKQEKYVLPDTELVHLVPASVDHRLLIAVAGDKEHYTFEDAYRLLKQQKLEAGEHMTQEMRGILHEAGSREPRKMTVPIYKALMDRRSGFSPLGLRALLEELQQPVSESAVIEALGERDFHPTDEVVAFLKGRRLSDGSRLAAASIRQRADRPEGYSPDRMITLLRERTRYLLDRGATRNNPHIPRKELLSMVPKDQVIPANAPRKAQRLEELVKRELQTMHAARDAATA